MDERIEAIFGHLEAAVREVSAAHRLVAEAIEERGGDLGDDPTAQRVRSILSGINDLHERIEEVGIDGDE